MWRGATLAVACVALMTHAATAALMSIDLGSEYLKVCLVKPGRTPISIAVNEMSKRKSPALVGVVNGERLLGEEAFSFAVRYPESIFQRARDFLGKDPDDPTIAAMLTEQGLPYKVVPHPKRGVASLQLADDTIYSPEELVGSILYYARQIAEAQAGAPVLDAVISVPAFFGQRQRQAMADAAHLAGLNLMGLINTHTSAALQYGIERDFANRSQTVILYDMGSGTTEVALVKYSTYTVKEAGKPRTYNQLEVRDVDWDASLGANLLDMALAKHFAAQFAEKSKLDVDVMALPKAMAKMRRQVRRTKEMLSANSAAPCTVEELHDGRDFQSSITREEFESLAADFFSRATAPLKRILERNGLQPEDIDAVELLGGGSRVPRLQAALSEVLGGRGLDRHLDADEAIALGAGLFAANLSTSFRLRKFGMVDMTMYGISLTLDHVVLAGGEDEAAASEKPAGGEPFLKVRNLLPYMKKLPNKRVVKLERLAGDPLRFSLAYNASTHHGLPPGVRSPELAEFEATGVEEVIQRYNTSGLVSLRFEADYSGLFRLDKVEAVVEYEVMEEKIIEVPVNETIDTNVTATAASGEQGAAANPGSSKGDAGATGSDSEAEKVARGAKESPKSEADSDTDDNGEGEAEEENDGSNGSGTRPEEGEAGSESEASEAGSKKGAESGGGAAKEDAAGQEHRVARGMGVPANTTGAGSNGTSKPATTIKRIQVPKVKVAKVPLKVGGKGWLSPPLSDSDLSEAKQVLSKFVAAEARKREVAKARNDLESYIIAMKEALETDELMQKVSTEEQRESFRSRLTDEEDWLYMEADENEGAQQFKDRLKQLKDIGEPIKRRAEDLELRPKVVEEIRKRLELQRSVVKAWPDTKPWISEVEREDITKLVSDMESDLEAKVAAQSAKADHEEPAFAVSDLLQAWERHEKAFNKVNNKKKPKPPPEPKPASGSENADAAGGAGAGEGATGDAPGDAKAEPEQKRAGGQGSEEGTAGAAGGAEDQEATKREAKKAGKAEGETKEAKKAGKADGDTKEAKKDGKTKKEQPKKNSKGKKEPKKDSKATEDTKKESKAKPDTRKESSTKGSEKKDQKKSWSWNKRGEEL
ncbi:heat shock protein Hsp70G [Volvox carteri f. nagariensis]|uniref:Heat shock protein Hsp70G n=1 Tax=Volvox carteri f. nagariensis TaxID=3068 RepID=D8TJA4_VOLCA|nr:heat shock protein Hsp70G [Volvox carteri f. nagariensis]EFJ52505.1 heat shock protein Hsp70G [Volvox carteri f. nagariensis]|eukprot:XP_002946578.1 heat shock protein Hsp70G [Volvox carteri f. nagariensis]